WAGPCLPRLWLAARLSTSSLGSAVDGRMHGCRAVVGDQVAGLCRLKQLITHLLLLQAATGDDLEQIEGSSVERVIARARLGSGNRLAFPLERSAGPCSTAGLFPAGELEQPCGRRNRLLGPIRIPAIDTAVGVPTRRQTD